MKINCFGDFTIIDDDNKMVQLCDMKSKKARSLLRFFIANRGKWISTTMLCEYYWPSMNEQYAKMSLQCAVHAIRKLLESKVIIHKEDGYVFDPDFEIEIDAEIFDKLIKEALITPERDLKKRLLFTALEMYKGDYMQEILYEDWVLRQREYYKEVFITALLECAKLKIEESMYDDAIKFAQRALEEDIFNERACYLLMVAYWKKGNRTASMKLFKEFSQRLQRELNVNPSSDLINLHQMIISNLPEKKIIVVERLSKEIDLDEVLSQLKKILRPTDKVEKLSVDKIAIWLDGMNEKGITSVLLRVQSLITSSQLNVYIRNAR
ncbi:transcriptional regulator, SARP family [Pseudothermotoga thermarum DSM 5069]|uniref:Transcriptional regulator, SARP family n=2 Tax=Pseudothermotoga thermarum TaxID=119394 RepID=F7YX67_9THEM|nr:transcriptional regulator, SARP family [Pseudothermotoga thermarum DSM 5069]